MKVSVAVLTVMVALLIASLTLPKVAAADCNQKACIRACNKGIKAIQVRH